MSDNCCVIVFPVCGTKDAQGRYTMLEYLFFHNLGAAWRCLDDQDFKDGHEWYEVPLFHKGAIIRTDDKLMLSWSAEDMQDAEDYAIYTGLKLIEVNRALIE
jgi:hypothetical protein